LIVADLGTSHAFVGLLTTIPVLCLGLCAPLGPRFARRAGARTAMATLILLLAASAILRGAAFTPQVMLLLTAAIGLAAGAAGALPPVLTKQRVASKSTGRASGLTTSGIAVGATVAVAAAVPLTTALGGWRPTLIVMGVAAIPGFVAWLALVDPGSGSPISRAPGPPARLRFAAWLLAGAFGLQAALYWSAGAWLPATLGGQGLPGPAAGGLVGVLNAAALAGNLATAAFSDRLGPRDWQLLSAAGTAAGGCLVLVLAPVASPLAAALLGLGCGATYPLILACAVDIADDAHGAGRIASLVALVGYPIAAAGPVMLGVARDVTGNYGATIPALVLGSAGLVATAAVFTREQRSRRATARVGA
jgi:CP family cyanate transporter-like MFS transporter